MRTWPVMIKPTAATRLGSAYLCPGSLYRPDDQTMRQVVGAFAGPDNAAELLRRAEQLAETHWVNILGAAFMAVVELAGIDTRSDFCADVTPARRDVIGTLYPDLRNTVAGGNLSHAVANNVGRFVVLTASLGKGVSGDLRETLTEVKVRYRKEVSRFVVAGQATVRDHLVHVPEDVAEATDHVRILRSCATGRADESR